MLFRQAMAEFLADRKRVCVEALKADGWNLHHQGMVILHSIYLQIVEQGRGEAQFMPMLVCRISSCKLQKDGEAFGFLALSKVNKSSKQHAFPRNPGRPADTRRISSLNVNNWKYYFVKSTNRLNSAWKVQLEIFAKNDLIRSELGTGMEYFTCLICNNELWTAQIRSGTVSSTFVKELDCLNKLFHLSETSLIG